MQNRFTEYFQQNADALTADAAALVAVQSQKGPAAPGAPYGHGPREALEAAAGLAEAHGLSAKVLGDRVCLVEMGSEAVQRETGEPALGILAHLDVVPAAGTWTKTDPFKLLEEDGILYGRGVADDKGPAVAALYALCCIQDLGIPLKRRVQLILGSDEENGSDDIAWYLRHYRMPPRVFTPDASFPLVSGEKGKLDMTVTAPAVEGALVSLHGGSVSNAVPSECEAVLSGIPLSAAEEAAEGLGADLTVTADGQTLRVLCRGKAAHASTPELGVNAVQAMLVFLSRLPLGGMDGPIRALAAAMPFGDFQGRTFGAFCEDADTGALTVNLGVLTYDGEHGLSGKIDCRVPRSGDGRRIAARLQDALAPGGVSVKLTGLLPPHSTPRDSDLVQGLLRIYEDYTGEKGEALTIGGLTYVHEVEGGVAFGCEFPGTDYHMHEPDESMPLRHLLLSGAMFAQAIYDFCC